MYYSIHIKITNIHFIPYFDSSYISTFFIFQTDVLEGGWGPKTLVQNQTIKVFGSDKMDWRGESFVITGKILILQCMIGAN